MINNTINYRLSGLHLPYYAQYALPAFFHGDVCLYPVIELARNEKLSSGPTKHRF